MPVAGDDRGVSPIIGAILLAGIFILLLAVVQTQAVPSWNHDVEFDHNQRVTEDLEQLQAAISQVGTTGTTRSITIELGTTYPQRFMLQNNAPNPTGALTTDPAGSLNVSNTRADGDTADYWTGDDKTFTTRALVYTPSYNYFQTAPDTIYEHGVLANQFQNTTLSITSQPIIDGRRLTLLVLAGDISRAQAESTSVTIQPVSTSTRSISVSDAAGDPITITVPTLLPNATWSDLLDDEYTGNGGFITEQSYETGSPYNRLTLSLKADETYELRLAKVGIDSGNVDESAWYVVASDRPSRSITEGTSHRITIQVRDRLNNPVSGFTVNASANRGSFTDTAVTTDPAGEAVFNYSADFDVAAGETKPADLEFSAYDGSPARNVSWVNLSVHPAASESGDDSGGDEGFLGGTNIEVLLDKAQVVDDGDEKDIRLTFNSNADKQWTAFEARSVGYYTGQSVPLDTLDFQGTTFNATDDFKSISNFSVSAGGSVEVSTDNHVNVDGSKFDAASDQLFIIAIRFDDQQGNQTATTYVAQPQA